MRKELTLIALGVMAAGWAALVAAQSVYPSRPVPSASFPRSPRAAATTCLAAP